jgi:hypothetical protein
MEKTKDAIRSLTTLALGNLALAYYQTAVAFYKDAAKSLPSPDGTAVPILIQSTKS